MDLPFSAGQFVAVLVRYNEAVWPLQWLLNGLALAAVGLLFWRRAVASRWIAGILALLWGWMAVGYHLAFFTAINPAAWGFGALFIAGAIVFAWMGVVRQRLSFALPNGIRGWSGAVLLVFALVLYPLAGYASGQRYPAVPTFGLPCPTTIFTLGLLLLAAAPVPRAVFVVPLLWSAIGSVAAFQLGVVQDYGLLAAGLLGLAAALWPAVMSLPGPGSVSVQGRAGMRTGT